MGYRRETLVLRAPGGGRTGFLIWERGARQGSLRCTLDGVQTNEELRLLWLAEGSFELRDGGVLRGDASGAVRQTLLIAGDIPLVGVVVARNDGSMCAHAFVSAAQGETAPGPERLQALLGARKSARPVRRDRSAPDDEIEKQASTKADVQEATEQPAPSTIAPPTQPERWTQELEPYRVIFERMEGGKGREILPFQRVWQSETDGEAIPRGLELRVDGRGLPERMNALWRAPAWPPPPGIPGAVWQEGHWTYPLAGQGGE